MPVLALTFDLDGTLAEVQRRKARLWKGLLRHPRALPALPRAVEALRGVRAAELDEALVAWVVAETGVRPDAVRTALRDELDGRWPRLFSDARPPPAIQALIEACDARRLPRAVVSDHPSLDKLAAMDLHGWAAVIDCRRLGALKPLPDALLAAAAQLGVPTTALLHVGDRPDTDGAMAAAAGARYLDVADLTAPAQAHALLADACA
ncbi:MAG: HAD family hydrolase [Alphaproteobacteria bacterium]|nr:HAD family hydrolase [Alphaproteobacteria bacterium]